jgi:hypothetical protein
MFQAILRMPVFGVGVGGATWFRSTSHAHRDNDHKGNSPENGSRRKIDVWELSSTFGGLRHFRVNDHITSMRNPYVSSRQRLLAARSNVVGRGRME